MKERRFRTVTANIVICVVLGAVLATTVAALSSGSGEVILAGNAVYEGDPESGRVALMFNVYEGTGYVEEIAALGKDCVIVGRNADVILRDKNPLRLFVCATESAKLRRCRERAPEDERLSDKGMLRKMREIDKNRAIARGILCGEPWGDRQSYHLIVNTSDWDIKQLAASLAEFALCRFGGEK